MGKPVIYIDGQSGTTGLQIRERLAKREDLELAIIPEEKRHDNEERKKYLNSADIVFFCLPDDAAREAAAMIENPAVRVIDASTAHRVAEGWDYGIPELSTQHRTRIKESKRVANPGCHATGFITSVYPLVAMGIIPKDLPLTVFSLTGYSGGGKKMIAEYEAEGRDHLLDAPRVYGLTLHHKHLPEMQKVCGLDVPPVFIPVVDDYYKGMAVTVMLHTAQLNGHPSAADVQKKLSEWYLGEPLLKVHEGPWEGMISAGTYEGRDSLELIVSGHEDQIAITALFDNLGKGASGAAVQNMNLMLGLPETTGLAL
ncbi:MAG: N-acetyl-gamma-glutamyl-phosphate reductase [Clostridium sp.]|nr:N-acetyl-gamma-glutamyl-phosphate reductase [Clostridium sp.]